ncbi:MAG: ABC transporter permease [Rhodobacteraceae bacterium]|jgi:capsular polysaccharide transport system permease protein|nr:ABC transporter permease [Paracoccaceae bacterium]
MRYRPFSGTRVVIALMLREMATTYGRSPGGYVWTIVEPVAGIGLMTVVFSFIVHAPVLGSSFSLFYATGFLPFVAYLTITNRVGGAIRYSRPLLAYPSVTFIDTILSRLFLVLLTELLVMILVLGGIHILFSVDAAPNFGKLVNAFGMLTILGLGFGLINCYLFGVYPVWEQFWSILNRPLFLVSGLFFLIEGLPEQMRNALLWNPIAHIIIEFRAGIYPTYEGYYASPIYVYSIGLVCTAFGLLLLYRDHRYLVNEGA